MNPENQTKSEDSVKDEPSETNKENGADSENKENGSESKENIEKMDTDVKEEPEPPADTEKEVEFLTLRLLNFIYINQRPLGFLI